MLEIINSMRPAIYLITEYYLPGKMKFSQFNLHPRFLSCLQLQLILFFSMNFLCLQASALGNETDRLALLKFKESITSDPFRILDSWNDSLPFCNWYGVACGRKHQRVTSLVLNSENLGGTISPYIGNLSFLIILNLQNNSFHGEIPREVGNFRLQQLFLNNNTLTGEIPVNLSDCSSLRIIRLSWNNIAGKIPEALGSLSKLEDLRFGENNLTGEIPASFGNLSSLIYFYATDNNLVGSVPDDIGRLTRLTVLSISVNQLSGVIPPLLFNASSIQSFSIAENQLNGSLPDNIGVTLPNLQFFGIGVNEFYGAIPTSFSNASQLRILDISRNNFVGQVPTDLGNLQDLQLLNVGYNRLGNNSTNDLHFVTHLPNCSNLRLLAFEHNNLGGVLPESIANLSIELIQFYIGGNQIGGNIPAGLEHFINLIVLAMQDNLFTGTIPSSLGKIPKLQALAVNGNLLSGQIPSSIGNLTILLELYLQENKLEGSIPGSIGNSQNLYYLSVSQNKLSGFIPVEILGLNSLSKLLNLSQNSLTGNLPEAVGKLENINKLDVSDNSLLGEIPETIGDCLGLEYLYMQGNSFQGAIPSSLANLKGLQTLDLSRNNLVGEIPVDLQNLHFLLYLNLSFNDLEGEVPTAGVFRNASAVSLIGNSKLCGGVPELNLSKCPTRRKSGKFHALKLIIIIISALLFVLLMSAFLFLSWVRKSKKNSASTMTTLEQLPGVSYKDLHQATDGFSPTNLIGSSNSSLVFKGFLEQLERPVAIKVLNLQRKGASKSVIAECNALRNVRHRNLVKVITFCSSLDYQGNEFKALVLEFMENGTLEEWLHIDTKIESHQSRNLSLLQRLNISIDVASAMHYLHDLCERPIIHRDLKPSNVLLDNDMVAHVSDFGLAKLLSASSNLPLEKSSTTGIMGTIGYAAPEYGMGSEASKEGDVYSFGILMLEMFSGKRPTDEMFKDGLDLHDYVKAALLEKLIQIVDSTLLPRNLEGTEVAVEEENWEEIAEQGGENNSPVQKCLLLLLEIGVNCSSKSPKDRMSMEEVTRKLHSIKKVFLGTQGNEQDPVRI